VNLVLLEPDDFVDADRVRLHGRRLKHIRSVQRVSAGAELRIGIVDGKIGHGRIESIETDGLEMQVSFDRDPPPPLPLHLVLALPRPKVLNRTIAAAASMGIREIDLINSWRVEKSYLRSPRVSPDNLRAQCILGLEQSGDTILPTIRLHRLFTPFVRGELPAQIRGRRAFVAHPAAETVAPRDLSEPLLLAIGPEGGFIDKEVDTFREIGFTPITFGPRILRVETTLAYLAGRLFR
jgi:RsmE family RNA methyltransferase